MTGVGIVTYNRENKFSQITQSIQNVDCVIAVKDGGGPSYTYEPDFKFIQLEENKGVGFCKNIAIDALIGQGCEHIFILEDDCLVTDNSVWEYCRSFSRDSGLLHFNWDDYNGRRSATAQFKTHKAAICHDTAAIFSYFHKTFLHNIRFDTDFLNAWEHIDIMMQGEAQGFLPPFRSFVSPSDLSSYLTMIDDGESTISGKDNYVERVSKGYDIFVKKWGKHLHDIPVVPLDVFYEKMKEITIKYAKR